VAKEHTYDSIPHGSWSRYSKLYAIVFSLYAMHVDFNSHIMCSA